MAIVSGGGNVTPAKMLLMMGFKPKNEIVYTPATWSEWAGKTAACSVVNGFLAIENNASDVNISLNTNLKLSTKYGILYNVRTNTRTATTQVIGSNSSYPLRTYQNINAGVTGNFKSVQVSAGSMVSNKFYSYISVNSGKFEYGNIRVFELPTGSQIEADFDTLTADQLNALYPF
jgi:hypothetical protein